MQVLSNKARQDVLRKTPSYCARDIRLQRAALEKPGPCTGDFMFEQAIRGLKLSLYPVDPRLMMLFRWTKASFVHDLHGLLAGGKCEADDALSPGVRGRFSGGEAVSGGRQDAPDAR